MLLCVSLLYPLRERGCREDGQETIAGPGLHRDDEPRRLKTHGKSNVIFKGMDCFGDFGRKIWADVMIFNLLSPCLLFPVLYHRVLVG